MSPTARFLKVERLNKGLSIRAASEQIGVSRRVIQSAEAGQRPRPGNAHRVAEFYGRSVTDLWPLEDVAA